MTLDKWQRMTEWFMTALALVFCSRVFVGSAGENAYRIVRNGDQHHPGWRSSSTTSFPILLAKDKKAWFKENLLMLVSIACPSSDH